MEYSALWVMMMMMAVMYVEEWKGKKKNRRKTDDEWEVVVNRKLISRARGNVEKGEVKSWNEKYNGKIKINLRSKRNESTSHVSSTKTM